MSEEQTQDTYPNKDRASGYVDEQGRSIGESIINRVTELMIAPQTKMLQLAAHLEETRLVQDQRFGYILNQFGAFLEKEDARHAVYDESEAGTLAVLTSVAQRLDELTGYVQQGIATGVKALAVAERGVTIGEKALSISESTAKQLVHVDTRLGHVERQFAEVEKTVMALKKGQALSDEQSKQVMQDIADLRKEIEALRAAAELAARLAAQTAEIDRRLVELEAWKAALEAWRAALEARSDGDNRADAEV